MKEPINFESSLAQLQTIVAQLEKGELPLDDSLKQFEQGIILARKCQDILNQAEQKIEMLSTLKSPTNDDVPNE